MTPPIPEIAAIHDVATRYREQIVDLTTTWAQISSPTGDEGERAAAVAAEWRRLGYGDVETDDIQNVYGRIPGVDSSRYIVVSAHTDTVFPHGVDLTVTRERDLLHGPGIGDNTVAVASMTMLKPALEELGVQPACDIVVVANVGEEGLGDLRGMKAAVDRFAHALGFVVLEGQMVGRLCHAGVGSRRYRVKVTGPGGHSYGAAGTPSAIQVLADLVTRMGQIERPSSPKTTFNVGSFHGGVSVNTIAPEATALLDMRSVDPDALNTLVSEVDAILSTPQPSGVKVNVEVVGDRPAGSLPADLPLIQTGLNVLHELGYEPVSEASSTDANVPIARGIPAMCIGITLGEHAHREDEVIDVRPIPNGFTQVMAVLLRAAALA